MSFKLNKRKPKNFEGLIKEYSLQFGNFLEFRRFQGSNNDLF